KLSANTPASNENTMIGSATEPWTSATMLCLSDSAVIIHAAPTACTRPPKLDASAAIQSERNVWLRNKDKVEALSGITPSRSFPPRPYVIHKRRLHVRPKREDYARGWNMRAVFGRHRSGKVHSARASIHANG